MKTKVLWVLLFLVLMLLGIAAFSFFTNESKKVTDVNNCTFEVKMCPDGSRVTRVGKTCDFAKCEEAEAPLPPSSSEADLASTTIAVETAIPIKEPVPKAPKPKEIPVIQERVVEEKGPSIFSSIISSVTSLFKKADTVVAEISNSIPHSTYIEQNKVDTTSLPPQHFAGEKYIVRDGNVVSNNNTIIYTIPASVIEAVSSTTGDWENHIVNVVKVGEVAPVLNAIPVKDLPGKYYLSQNSFGDIESCEFSNKIFILDSKTNEVTLMYEENNLTLSKDDTRACNSEIFLLATEDQKLILKYHTLNTNTMCDSAWSEPDKTWYLDVTNLAIGMRKYSIPEHLRDTAEQEEDACRANL